MPLAQIVADFTATYPQWRHAAQQAGDFLADVERERP
jgi:hypothetical protein